MFDRSANHQTDWGAGWQDGQQQKDERKQEKPIRESIIEGFRTGRAWENFDRYDEKVQQDWKVHTIKGESDHTDVRPQDVAKSARASAKMMDAMGHAEKIVEGVYYDALGAPPWQKFAKTAGNKIGENGFSVPG